MPDVPLLELKNLRIARSRGGSVEPLVRNLSLSLDRGQSLGLVGESGSGKSLTALAVMNLLPEPEVSIAEGEVRFQGQNLQTLDARSMNELRGSRLAIIVQDALAALNPVKRIQVQLEEVFRFHRREEAADARRELIHKALKKAGLPDTDHILRSYPHELSGGMRQRVLLAMALLLGPDLLIADEPTTALDVTLQARWVEQVKELQREQKLALLFISHDLALVAELCDEVAVLYRGHLVEQARTEILMDAPRHPYTKAMMQALPRAGRMPHAPERRAGESENQDGCPYAPFCPLVQDVCRRIMPELQGPPQHRVACHAVKD
ncbi:MAG TPA: ABC transporter ATP-binding protein [Oligoflexus sp.]|uniref:ABC transporter ATP-binding protein n=1 Tax=Oligoflexus sp. TaxID=1971216 RepID=UPI002D80664B|nr:ABC transporter ATP-binding protein [Oligoflexus sp.]HET9240898.1 ABC transporter ATP-binding protein [Oligoflexus sp.]